MKVKKKVYLLAMMGLIGLSHSFGQLPVTHIASNGLNAYPGTDFVTSTNNLYFIGQNGHGICSINKEHWTGDIINPSNASIPNVRVTAGLKWHNNKLYYVETDNKLSSLKWTSSGWERTHFNINTHSKTSFEGSSSNLYFVDANRKIRAKANNNSYNYVLVNNAVKARSGTDLVWKDNKLYYIGENNRIYYYQWTTANGWEVSGGLGSNIHSSSHLTVSNNNIYYVNTSSKMVSLSLTTNWAVVINSSAPLVKPGSDIKWVDEKLFYKGVDGDIYYHVWNRINSWEWNFFHGNNINSITQFGVTNHNQMVYIDNQSKVNYFRAPIRLTPTNNSIYKPGWILAQNFSDEFNTASLDGNKWYPHYGGGYNHPIENGQSMYYNETDLTSHKFYNANGNNVLALETTNKGAPYAVNVKPEDSNDGNYAHKSAMIMTKSKVGHGYIEMRCKIPKSNYQKYSFWTFGGSQNTTHDAYEIDIFEIEGEGVSYPTNYHEYAPGSSSATSDRYDINPLGGQSFADDFYVYGLEWDKDKITWYINNQVVRVIHKYQQYPNVLIADDLTRILATNRVWNHDYNIPSKFPNYYEIDYIRTYYKKPMKMATSKDIEVESIEEDDNFIVYPNPSSDLVNVKLSTSSQLTISNDLGQVIIQENLEQGIHEFNLGTYGAGIYFIKLISENEMSTQKVIIQ